MAEATTSTQERLHWADLAKGVCILLVVLVHVNDLHYQQVPWTTTLPVPAGWAALNDVFAPIRMPLFFAVSGMFAAGALRRPWRHVTLRRIVSPYYLYVLWVIIHAIVYTNVHVEFFEALRVVSVSQFGKRLVVPVNSLWYVYALALYFPVAKALQRAPAWVVLAGAGVMSAVAYSAPGWITPPGMLISVQRNFVFFLTGVYLAEWLKKAASGAMGSHERQLVLAGVAYAACTAAYLLGRHRVLGLDVLAGLAAIWLGVVATAVATRWRSASRLGGYLGRHTLPIYLMHGPLIALLVWLTGRTGAPVRSGALGSNVVAALYPLVVTAVIVAGTLLLHRLLLLAKADWLFRLPARRSRPSEVAASPIGPLRATGAQIPPIGNRGNGATGAS